MKLIVQPADGPAPLLKAIKQAQKSIEIVIFRFDLADLEHALEDAAERGVRVHALIAFTNRGGEKSLRKLEMRFLEKGITVARTADDLVRYHGKMMLVDSKELYLLTYNFTRLDTRSRSFGVATKNRDLVQEASRLFEADTTRQAYTSRCDKLVVSPANARKRLAAFLKGAKRELLIYDVDIADKEMLRILEDRCLAGVTVKIIGHVGASKHLTARTFGRMRLHTRVIIRDGKQLFLGSQSLRKLELDARREIGMIVNSPRIVSAMATVFDDDWNASVPGTAEKKHAHARAERASKKAVKIAERKLSPAPVVKDMLKVIESEVNVDVDPSQAAQVVKGALKKAVKKAAAKIVEEAVAK
ncbi:MAG TPA: phospholipase D-like domain-containing protein [Candidatus Sulfotelmatobacter sp.]|nr:phospholipase D-like domain-containing protein [Candidatus Sulfotelmatobacter sp.]